MARRRSRACAAAVLALGLAGADPAAPSGRELVRFLSPDEGALVIGPTAIRFEVLDASVERIDVYVEGRLIGAAVGPNWALTWDAPPGLAGARIAAGVYAGGALAERLVLHTAEASIDETIDVVAVELYPVVTDRRGAYVHGLGRDDFRVFDRGVEVPIATFASEAQSLHLALLVDRSESMRGKLSAVQAAASDLLDKLAPDDYVGVFAFNHQLEEAAPLSGDRAAARSSIASLVPAGGTALYDAVLGVIRRLDAVRGRKVLLVFSDGRDERSLASLARTVEAARNRGVIVYTVGSGDGAADLAARDDLRRMAQESGGQAYLIDRLRGLPDAFARILADVRAQYAITFAPRSLDPGEHGVVVQVRDGALSVRCRDRYVIEER
jgi:Ca-activated chloride channel homolog